MMMMNMGGGSMGGGMNMSDPMSSMGSMGGMSSGSMAPMGQMGNGYMQPMPYQGYMGGHGQMPMDPNAVHGAANAGHGATGHAAGGVLGMDITALLTTLFNFAIGIFAILLVVGLIVGTVVFIKRYLFDGMNSLLPQRVNYSCPKCGQTVKAEWNCCPKCGEMKAQATVPVTQ